jgi:acyl-CoA dehydrogenase
MTITETRDARADTLERAEAHNLGELSQRATAVAAVAAADADAVDREAKFPYAAIDAAKANRLLGVLVPREFGGEDASIFDVTDLCYTLGRACSSTGMIVAMHHVKVACIVRHGRGNTWQEAFMRRIAAEQMLLASSTTEGQGGGNVRSSAAAIARDGNAISLDRDATVISYGAEADGLVTVARREGAAAASDQVLLALAKDDYTLTRTTTWDTLGMRGTCSTGFALKARGVADQIVPEPYDRIHAQTMVPYAHLCWSSVWAGIAAAAVERAQAFIRKAARGANGQLPPGSAHFTEAQANLNKLRALITTTAEMYATREFDDRALGALDFQSAINLLKVEASELAGDIVMSALRATGLSGYRNDGSSSVARQLRDVLSAPLMINNDRIRANIATATLMSGVAPHLRS